MANATRIIVRGRVLGVCRVAAVTTVVVAMAFPARAKTFRCSAGDALCLIAAINEANANGHHNTIRLAAGVYPLENIDNDTDGPNGLPSITSNLTIKGNGAATVARASSAPVFRLMHVGTQGNLTLDGLTLTGGGAGFTIYAGAGLFNNGGVVNITRSTVSENHSVVGAALFNSGGVVNITSSTFANNLSGEAAGLLTGGAGSMVRITHGHFTRNQSYPEAGTLVAYPGERVFISNTTFDHNTSGAAGVVVVNGFFGPGAGATMVVTDSAITENQSQGNGAGMVIYPGGTAFVRNTTVDGNTLTFPFVQGEGIANFGTLILVNSTLADNAGSYPGLLSGNALFTDPNATTILANTIVARNTSKIGNQDCTGTTISVGNNLIGEPAGCTITLQPGDRTGDPGLGTFTDNGRPGYGHVPLLATSQAIDAGNDAFCPRRDQLGQRRIGPCDIGAVEFRANEDHQRETADDSSTDRDVATAAPPDLSDLVANLAQVATALQSATDGNRDISKQVKSIIDLVASLVERHVSEKVFKVK